MKTIMEERTPTTLKEIIIFATKNIDMKDIENYVKQYLPYKVVPSITLGRVCLMNEQGELLGNTDIKIPTYMKIIPDRVFYTSENAPYTSQNNFQEYLYRLFSIIDLMED